MWAELPKSLLALVVVGGAPCQHGRIRTRISTLISFGRSPRPTHQTTVAKPLNKLYTASQHLTSPTIWTDGSAQEAVFNGGSGAYIQLGDSDREISLTRAAGSFSSSYRAEVTAINEALHWLADNPQTCSDAREIHILTDSQSAIANLAKGPSK